MTFRLFANKAERAARRILKEHDLAHAPVIPNDIALALNLRVVGATFAGKAHVTTTATYDRADRIIYVNIREITTRRFFAAAQIIGHYVLHHDWLHSAEYQPTMCDTLLFPSTERDQEAYDFARELLIPRRELKMLGNGLGVEHLLTMFPVPRPVMVSYLGRQTLLPF